MKALRISLVASVSILSLALCHDGCGQSSLSNGLVAYYPFNGNAEDESGNGHNPVLVQASPGPDRYGLADSALRFNGYFESNLVVVPRIGALDFNQDFSLSLWVNVPGGIESTPPAQTVVNFGPDNSNVDIRLLPSAGPEAVLVFSWGQPLAAVHVNVPLVNWWQIAVIRSGHDLALYRNGSLLASAVMDTGPAWNQLWLGMNQNGDWPLLGRIDEVRLYSRALSPAEVQQLLRTGGSTSCGS